MLPFKDCKRTLSVFIIISFLSACSSLNQGFEALKDLTNISNDSIEVATGSEVALPVDRFKQSQKPLTLDQKALLSELKPLIDTAPADNTLLKSKLHKLETELASQGSNKAPSILLLALGDAYRTLGQSENAVSAWQQSVRSNKFNYFAHDRLAQQFRQQGDFSQAEQHYTMAIEAWADFAEGYRNRGILYDLYLGDKGSALSDYENYKQLLMLAGAQTREVDRWIKEMQRAVNQ